MCSSFTITDNLYEEGILVNGSSLRVLSHIFSVRVKQTTALHVAVAENGKHSLQLRNVAPE